MKPSSIIGHVREAATSFLTAPERPADQRLREFYRTRRYLGSRDRREISRLYYRLVRRYRAYLPYLTTEDYDRVIPPAESVRSVLGVLLLSETDHAPEDVSAGCAIDPEILRGHQTDYQRGRAGETEADDATLLARRHGFPVWLVTALHDSGHDDLDALLGSLDGEADVALRFDPARTTFREVVRQLQAAGVAGEIRRSVWSDHGIVLTERPVLSTVPSFRDGSLVLQDIGSQMVGLAAAPRPGERLFDACAGAGGKTLHLVDLLEGTGAVVAHDAVASRLNRLARRLDDERRRSVTILSPEEYRADRSRLSGTFDLVLIDAPCSGTGTFRRNPGLKLTLTPEDVERASHLQREILQEYSHLVRSGGRLVYATCSLLEEENARVVERFLASRDGEFEVEPVGGVPAAMIESPWMRTRPDRHGTDGFFSAEMRRH